MRFWPVCILIALIGALAGYLSPDLSTSAEIPGQHATAPPHISVSTLGSFTQAFYIAPPAQPWGQEAKNTDKADRPLWHGNKGDALDWGVTNRQGIVKYEAYARGWGYYPGAAAYKLRGQAFYRVTTKCHAVWWEIRETGFNLVLGVMKHVHVALPRSASFNFISSLNNYYNQGFVIGYAVQQDFANCSFGGANIHEDDDGGVGGYGTWDQHKSVYTAEGWHFNNEFAKWTRRVRW